jgi:aryl-alcohol dehydrogenase
MSTGREITAAVLRSSEAPYALEGVHLAAPAAGEVLVRVVGVGMCHTDVVPRAGLPMGTPPIIPGHEGAGVVEAVGDGVSTVRVGDHVVLSFDSCGTCRNCRRNQPAYCDTFMARNLVGRRLDGSSGVTDASGAPVSAHWFGQSSFATHCLATARNAVVVDRSLPLELLGPLGCGIQTGAGSIAVALNTQPGEQVVVFGSGAVGTAAIMAAKVAGASTIVAVDLHQHRLDLAQELGATHGLLGTDEHLEAHLLDITNGGADVSFDTTGVPSVMRSALTVLRMTGRCGYVGMQLGDLVLDGAALIGKTATGILEGGVDPQQFIPQMIRWWQDGRFPFDRLIQTYPLSDINTAEQASLSGAVVKPVLLPG